MTDTHSLSPVERPITRVAVETSVAIEWNAAGAEEGLPPIAWKLGDPCDGIHFAANADAYAPGLRRDIIESWIVALGLADQFDLLDEPIHRAGSQTIWTGSVDGVTFQFRYPADSEI